MPRIIVTTDPSPSPAFATVWFDEHVQSVHLSTGHAAAQFLERLAWAISDAEGADIGRADRLQATRSPRRGRSTALSRGSLRVRG
jgi:hypothetical protein